ncbi:MAG: CoA ligase [Herminiimonas sp.]|nr:CoA ligase [Herminiimonas sp.]
MFPLISHQREDSVIAWRDGGPVTASRFLSDVAAVCAHLPDGRHMLNACGDRYRFAVGFAAALVSKRVCLLPSTQAPEMIHQLAQFAPDAFCLTDNADCTVALPQIQFPALAETSGRPEAPFDVPEIDGAQLAAYVFTSGSTGVPVPHKKNWGALVRNVRAEAQLCNLNDGRSHAVIGTVPPQHMYGFESTVLIVLQSGNALVAGHSFYPADVCNAIHSVPRPRVLVSTPVHLRSVISAGLDTPPVDLVLSATAPLSVPLAKDLETRFQAPLLEIYGSTETGQIAVRSTAKTEEWQLFPGVSFTRRDDVTWASGGHIEQPTPMNDVIECRGAGDRFLLHGRNADLINIAGKRNSLAYLNLQLNAIPGVLDGAFFMPDTVMPDGVTRLTAFVVAPDLTPTKVLAALRQRVDAVFLPRPLVFVDTLPRNATGKLPREALKTLALANARSGA